MRKPLVEVLNDYHEGTIDQQEALDRIMAIWNKTEAAYNRSMQEQHLKLVEKAVRQQHEDLAGVIKIMTELLGRPDHA